MRHSINCTRGERDAKLWVESGEDESPDRNARHAIRNLDRGSRLERRTTGASTWPTEAHTSGVGAAVPCYKERFDTSESDLAVGEVYHMIAQ